MKNLLKLAQVQAMTSRQASRPNSTPEPDLMSAPSTPNSRPFSPAPSTSSSSSSLSTTSTHTVVPSNNRPLGQAQSDLASMPSKNRSSISLSSNSTARPQKAPARKPTLRSRSSQPTSSSFAARHLSPPRYIPSAAATRHSNLSTFSLIKAYLAPYATSSSITTMILVFIVFPALSLVIRARRRKLLQSGAGVPSNASLTRQQLMLSQRNALSRIWALIIRTVFDTIRMAGSGLV
jgi:hypothetical protein